VRANRLPGASAILLTWTFLLSSPLASQMPAPLGRLHITSTAPGASITVNGILRKNNTTPVTLAVVPGTYAVIIGTCKEQTITVTVASGETKEVTCKP
jgi:hypothetical protein